MIMRAEAFEGCAVELFAVIRMGDADEKLGAFLHRLSVEIHGSVFGDYVVDVRSGGNHSAALDDDRCYLAAAFLGGGGIAMMALP